MIAKKMRGNGTDDEERLKRRRGAPDKERDKRELGQRHYKIKRSEVRIF